MKTHVIEKLHFFREWKRVQNLDDITPSNILFCGVTVASIKKQMTLEENKEENKFLFIFTVNIQAGPKVGYTGCPTGLVH